MKTTNAVTKLKKLGYEIEAVEGSPQTFARKGNFNLCIIHNNTDEVKAVSVETIKNGTYFHMKNLKQALHFIDTRENVLTHLEPR